MSTRSFVTFASMAALAVGCMGRIGSGEDGAGTGGPDDPDLDPDAQIESGELPIRMLTAAEIRYVLGDLFPDKDFTDVALGPKRPEGKYSTYAELQAVSSVSHQNMENVLGGVADRAVGEDAHGFLGCDPDADQACVEAFLRDFGPRVFRRAFDDEEVTRFETLYRALRGQGDVRSATTGVLQALLLSPYFLYHFHDAPDGVADASGRVRLRGEEIATRLSFLLWSSGPDDLLRDAVTSGELDTDEGVRAQAERMMKDPRFARFAEAFVLEWLEVDHVAELGKDATRIPEWSGDIAHDMLEEATRYAIDWGTSDAPTLAALLTSNDRFLNARLATFLGVEADVGEGFEETTVADRTKASGVFTLGSFLASHTTITGKFGPVYRGKWLRKRLMCGVIGSPPPDALTKAPKEESVTTTREYHEKLVEMPVCGGCHSNMDAMAFALESFDGAGRFRTTENGVMVDTSATVSLSGDAELDGNYANVAELADAYAASQVTHDCFGQNLTEYAFGRLVTPSTDRVQRDVGAALASGGLRDAMLALVTSAPFVTSLDPSKGAP